MPQQIRLPYKLVHHNGWEILVGRDAASNDTLTFEVAGLSDFWLHVLEDSGSHVVVRNPSNLAMLPPEITTVAAGLAVRNSKARSKGSAQVALGKVSDVHKTPGMAPGEVSLQTYVVVMGVGHGDTEIPTPDE